MILKVYFRRMFITCKGENISYTLEKLNNALTKQN